MQINPSSPPLAPLAPCPSQCSAVCIHLFKPFQFKIADLDKGQI